MHSPQGSTTRWVYIFPIFPPDTTQSMLNTILWRASCRNMRRINPLCGNTGIQHSAKSKSSEEYFPRFRHIGHDGASDHIFIDSSALGGWRSQHYADHLHLLRIFFLVPIWCYKGWQREKIILESYVIAWKGARTQMLLEMSRSMHDRLHWPGSW